MFSHLDEQNNPQMVDVSEKKITARTALARGILEVDPLILDQFDGKEIHSPKGAVFQTAAIAMTMAAKRTHEVVCFSHPISIENVKTRIYIQRNCIFVEALVGLQGKTGVEMEALHAVSVGLLNIHDMCKSINSNMVVREIKLLKKTGGKKDFISPELRKNPVSALILIGGESRRMGQDKYAMDMGKGAQLERLYLLFKKYFEKVYVSCSQKQREKDSSLSDYDLIVDRFNGGGPLGGIATALNRTTDALFVSACDLPFVGEANIEALLKKREEEGFSAYATVYFNEKRQKIEPLFGIYEPKLLFHLQDILLRDEKPCATRLLESVDTCFLPLDTNNLDNFNTMEDLRGRL